MKRLITTILCALIVAVSFARPTFEKKRNTIIILDCTKSMKGYGGAADIWESTKQYIHDKIRNEAASYPDASLIILPFQEQVLPPIVVDLKNVKWQEYEAKLDEYVDKITYTNICDAWLEAERKYIDENNCQNYILLMTDGQDNMGGDTTGRIRKLAEILTNFCGKHKNTHGFYIELTTEATLPDQIKDAIKDCIAIIPPGPTIPSFGGLYPEEFSLNTRDLPADVEIYFSDAGKFKAAIENADNEFVDISIKGDSITGGKLMLHIESKFDTIEEINDAINEDETSITFDVVGEDVSITNSELTLNLNAVPIRSLTLCGLDQNASINSEFERIKPFLWIKGNEIDTLTWDLKPEFSEQAIKDNAKVEFSINNLNPSNEYAILLNGVEIKNNKFSIKSSDQNAVIQMLIPQEANDGAAELALRVVKADNLDNIDGLRPDLAGADLKGSYHTSMSWLEIITWIICGLILVVLLIWFLFIKRAKYPKFRGGSVVIQNPYFATIQFRGNRKIVFTPTRKQQGFFNKLFTGRVDYHINPAWTAECEITPSGSKNIRFRCPSGQLVSTPTHIWVRQGDYKIIGQSVENTTPINVNVN